MDELERAMINDGIILDPNLMDKEQSASPAGYVAMDNELGIRLLDFLREINEQKTTPESNDVDDLLSLLSQYYEIKTT